MEKSKEKMEKIKNLKKGMRYKKYEKRFEIWKKILKDAEDQDFQVQCELYSEFVQEFPFTFQQWNDFAQLYANNGDNESSKKM